MLAARLSTASGMPEKKRPKSKACCTQTRDVLEDAVLTGCTCRCAASMCDAAQAAAGVQHDCSMQVSAGQHGRPPTCMVATWRPRYANTNISLRKDRNSKNWRSVTCSGEMSNRNARQLVALHGMAEFACGMTRPAAAGHDPAAACHGELRQAWCMQRHALAWRVAKKHGMHVTYEHATVLRAESPCHEPKAHCMS